MEETLDAIRNVIDAAHLRTEEVVILVVWAASLLLVIVGLGSTISAKDRQLAEATRLLEQRQVQLRRIAGRLWELVHQMETLAGAAGRAGGRLRLNKDGTLGEDDHERDV
ncbi:MAG: hypothetical protein IMZ44_11930 [Planctomycetes bacterium]|nr:hypothetical protein [Planctomycetota bacterium]